VRIVRAAVQTVQPWKNGGGTTREIARAPHAASLDAFDWRVSRAHVASDGPFSRFIGVDRTLIVLGGSGLCLDIDGATLALEPHSEPFSFVGDIAVDARLVGGPIDDLNVMTRRSRFSQRVQRRRVTSDETLRAEGDVLVVFVERGALTCGTETLTTNDALICEEREQVVVRSTPEARIVVIDLFRVTRLSGGK
jgi:environmental stress-induced protein Ves